MTRKREPHLSYSTASTLLTQSPKHAYLQNWDLGGQPDEPTPDMDLGNVLHSLILDSGRGVEVLDFADYRTTAAKEARDQARANRKTPILLAKFELAKATALAVSQQLPGIGIHLTGRSEERISWTESSNYGQVKCKGKLDHLKIEGLATIYEFKSIASADIRSCQMAINRFGYDIQLGSYRSAMAKISPELAGRIDFVWVFFEKEPPYAVTALRPDGVLRELGDSKWRRAVDLWARCLSKDEWPSYAGQIETVTALPWAMTQEMEAGSGANI